jgi:hypothetical protein
VNRSAVAERFAALIRRHIVFTVLLAAGITIRVLFVVAYYPAFWFTDSASYIREAAKIQQTSIHGPLYPAFLHVIGWFSGTGGDVWIAGVQHALVVGVACALYAVLVRRKLAPWLAALACSPLLVGGEQIVLEHFISTDALFEALAIASVLLLIGTERHRAGVYGAAGLLLGVAALDRPTALVMAGVALVIVLVRRVGWRPVVAFAIAAAVPVLINSVFWKPASWTDYDLRHDSTRYLYSRLAQFADCSKLTLTPQERTFCPPDPLDKRPERGDHYLWSSWLGDRPASDNAVISDFNKQVLVHQWPTYLWLITFDTSRFLVPGQYVGPANRCVIGMGLAPVVIRVASPASACEPLLAKSSSGLSASYAMDGRGAHPGMRVFLSQYSRYVNVPVVVNGLCLLLVVVAFARRRRSPLVAESVLALAIALSAIVVSMALMYAPRYGIPVEALFTVAGAMAGRALWARVPSRPGYPADAGALSPRSAVTAAIKEAD